MTKIVALRDNRWSQIRERRAVRRGRSNQVETAKATKNAKRESNATPACADVLRTAAEHSHTDSCSLAFFGVLGVVWRFHSYRAGFARPMLRKPRNAED